MSDDYASGYAPVKPLSTPNQGYGTGYPPPNQQSYEQPQCAPVAAPAPVNFGGPVYAGTPLYPDAPDALKTKFVKQGWQDLPWAIIFLATLVVTMVWGFINLGKFKDDFSVSSDDSSISYKIRKWIPGSAASSLGMSLVSLALMRLAPRLYIWVANLAFIGINVAIAIYCFAGLKSTYLGVMWIIMCLFHVLWLWLVRRRIPLAASTLSAAVSVVTKYYGAIILSFASLIILVIYLCFFALMVVPTMNSIENSSNNSTFGNFLLVCLFLLLFYWTTQVVVNVVHVTSCGTVATWYFAGPLAMPSNPSLASAKRALTTSFGSICLGSLIVALLKLIHAIVRSAARNRNGFIACIALCLIGCIERLMEWFNVYAFCHVAIYGCSFVEAAKRTWEMLKQSWCIVLINDNLCFPVLTLTSVFNSAALGVLFGFAAHSFVIGVLAFLVSYVIHILILRVVYSGVITIMVCFVENTQVLQSTNPAFYAELMEGVEALKQPLC